jgi:hypothetical protein
MCGRPNNLWILFLALVWLTTSFVSSGDALAEETNVSWQMTDKVTATDGEIATRVGTATFSNGEKAQIVSRVEHTSSANGMGGTASVDQVYKFDDGSGFTLRFEGIWNSLIIRTAGLFADGSGRFLGIRGGATGAGDFNGAALSTITWTGTYNLPKRAP